MVLQQFPVYEFIFKLLSQLKKKGIREDKWYKFEEKLRKGLGGEQNREKIKINLKRDYNGDWNWER